MRIGIYDPYLDTLGGHERYCLDLASCLADTHDVSIFWDDPSILKKAAARFDTTTRGITIVKNIWRGNILTKLRETSTYDVIFFVSDGSIPWFFSKKAFLLFEFPVPWVHGKTMTTQLKISRFTKIICNSPFVKKHIDEIFGVNSLVLLPGIDVDSFTPGKKEQLIVSVGRFTSGMNTKKQEVLIDAFKELCDTGLTGWKFVLAGGMLSQDAKFVEKLKKEAENYPIEITPNVSFKNLQSLYARAQVYWHAAGFLEDLDRHPERAEHFGISTVEAMSAGVVPIVYAGGGQKDIVENKVNGFLWKTKDELIEQTRVLLKDLKKLSVLSKTATIHAKNFSRKHFFNQVEAIL